MPVSYVQNLFTGQNKVSGASIALSGSKTITVGNTMFLAFASDTGTGSEVAATDNLGNTWSLVKSNVSGSAVYTALLSAPVTAGGTLTTVTISWVTAVVAKAAVCGEYGSVGTLNATDSRAGSGAVLGNFFTQTLITGDMAIMSGGLEGVSTLAGAASGSSSQVTVVRLQNGTSGGGATSNIQAVLVDLIATSGNTLTQSQFATSAGSGTTVGASAYYSPSVPQLNPIPRRLVMAGQAINRASTY